MALNSGNLIQWQSFGSTFPDCRSRTLMGMHKGRNLLFLSCKQARNNRHAGHVGRVSLEQFEEGWRGFHTEVPAHHLWASFLNQHQGVANGSAYINHNEGAVERAIRCSYAIH